MKILNDVQMKERWKSNAEKLYEEAVCQRRAGGGVEVLAAVFSFSEEIF